MRRIRRIGDSGVGDGYRKMGESGQEKSQQRIDSQKTAMLEQRAQAEEQKSPEKKVGLTKEQAESFQKLANMMVSQAPTVKEAQRVADELAKAVQNPNKETGEINVGEYSVSKDGDIKQSVKRHITSYLYTGIKTEERTIDPPRATHLFPMPETIQILPAPELDDTPPGEGAGWSGRIWVGGKKMHPGDAYEVGEGVKWVRVKVARGGYTVTLETSAFSNNDLPGDEEHYDLAYTSGDIHCDRF